jgi:hypothetical protein
MNQVNILVAYPYLKKDVIEAIGENLPKVRLLVDSGAFTAWKAGKIISVDDYCKFIEGLPFFPWRYFTLDVIGNAEKTLRNYQIMLNRGFKPIPIFTRGEHPSIIEEYYKTSDVVGIGGLVGTQGNKGFIKGIMKVIGDRKVHWLGFNEANFIAHYRPFMCDSSSWSSSFRYASAKVYDRAGRWIPFTKKDFAEKPDQVLLDLIRDHDVDPLRLAKNMEWSNGNREKEFAIETLTHRTWVKYQKDVYEKLKVNFFLACSTSGQVKLMIRAFNYWKSREDSAHNSVMLRKNSNNR